MQSVINKYKKNKNKNKQNNVFFLNNRLARIFIFYFKLEQSQ